MAGKRASKLWLSTAGVLVVGWAVPSVWGTITVDGTLSESDYGSALKVQTIDSSFGSNQLDAAYASVQGGNLYLFFSGNLPSGGNTLQIWFDDGRGTTSTLTAATTAGNMKNENGSFFSPDFKPSYGLEMNVNPSFFLDQYNFVSNTATFLGSFPVSNNTGSSQNLTGISAGYNNTNSAGIANGSGTLGSAASQTAAMAVTTGIELAIPLTTFSSTATNIKVMAALNGGSDSGLSNQVLPGLPFGTINTNIRTAPGTVAGSGGSTATAVNMYYGGTAGSTATSTKFNLSGLTGEYFNVAIPSIPNGAWLPQVGGTWSTSTNWSNGVIPGLAGDAATFSSATGASTVTLDATRTVGTVSFNSTFSYTLAAGTAGALVMDNGTSGAAINDFGGVHSITAPIVLNSTTTVTEQNHGDAMTLSGNISGVGGLTIANSGTSTLPFSTVALSGNNSWQGPTVISRGQLTLSSANALPVGTSLTMSSSSPNALLDLNGNNATISSLTVTGGATGNNPPATITNNNSSPIVSELDYAGTNANPSTFKGTLTDNSKATGGLLHLHIASGTLTLNGNDTYGGGTGIDSGATLIAASTLVDPNTHAMTGSALPINSNVANNGTLLISSSATAKAITGSGATTLSAGTLTVTQLTQNSFTIANDGSKVSVTASSGFPVSLQSLAVGDNTASANAQLDLNDNELVLLYSGGSSSSPVGSIRSLLREGFNSGTWDGNGIDSTSAHNDALMQHGIGYTDDGSRIDMKLTYYGDNNLDGKVDSTDFQMFLDGFAGGGSTWQQGDYNYDGTVDLGNDFNLFLTNFINLGGNVGALDGVLESDSSLSLSQKAELAALIPEPSSVALATMAAMGLASRRRRRELLGA